MNRYLGMCLRHIFYAPITEVLFLIITGTFLYIYIAHKMQSKGNAHRESVCRAVLFSGMIAYMFLILAITLMSREYSVEQEVSLVPFSSYYKYFHGEVEKLRESFMNILLFYPLGLISGTLFRKKRIVIIGMFLSLGIEISQYIFSLGYVEIDDVIHNTTGMLLGVLVMAAVRYISV